MRTNALNNDQSQYNCNPTSHAGPRSHYPPIREEEPYIRPSANNQGLPSTWFSYIFSDGILQNAFCLECSYLESLQLLHSNSHSEPALYYSLYLSSCINILFVVPTREKYAIYEEM